MSFSVDLWNGFDKIKQKINITYEQIKKFNQLLINYIKYEEQHCINLDQLYKDYKEICKSNYPLELSRFNIINMIDFESKLRKELINFVTKNIIEKISIFLSEPKIPFDKLFLDNEVLTDNFNKNIDTLATKQEVFHSQCKEFCLYLSQYELNDKNNNKAETLKLEKHYNKLLKLREDYLFYINETNIERKKYNSKKEELLNELENLYKTIIGKYKNYLFDFADKQCNMQRILYEKIKDDYKKYHSNIDLDQELFLFVLKNATKEFPMTQIEFCPFKNDIIEKLIKTKYNGKLNDKECNQLTKSVQTYFKSKNIFPNNLIQTGISKNVVKTQNDFYSGKKTGKKMKKNKSISVEKKSNTNEEKNKDKTPNEREAIILKNIKFIKKFLNELLTNGKVKMFEDIGEKINEKKDVRESMNLNQKIKELLNLIKIGNANSSVYIETVIKALSFIRPKGYSELNEFNYNLLYIIFIKILEENPKNDYMIKNILFLSQKFYKKEEEEKIYLQQKIKGLELLNSPEIWHRYINYSLCLENTDKDLTVRIEKNELNAKINKEAFNIIIKILCELKMFTEEEDVYEKVKYFYAEIYNLDKNLINQTVEDYLKNYNKNSQTKETINNQLNENINSLRHSANTIKNCYNKYENEMKLEIIDEEERSIKTEKKEGGSKEEKFIINKNNEKNKINENETKLINNFEFFEDFKDNIPANNFFSFDDSIFTCIKDDTNKKTNFV